MLLLRYHVLAPHLRCREEGRGGQRTQQKLTRASVPRKKTRTARRARRENPVGVGGGACKGGVAEGRKVERVPVGVVEGHSRADAQMEDACWELSGCRKSKRAKGLCARAPSSPGEEVICVCVCVCVCVC